MSRPEITAVDLARELREEAHVHGFGWLLDAVLERVARSYPEVRPALEPRRVYRTARDAIEDDLERREIAA